MVANLLTPWTTMLAEVTSELAGLIGASSPDRALIDELRKKLNPSPPISSTCPTQNQSLPTTLAAKDIICDYTMVEAHTPEEGEQYIIVGDFHGSLGTFVRLLYRWKIQGYVGDDGIIPAQSDGKKVNIVFLGDVCDRGVWGYELYYTLFYLFLVNYSNPNGRFYITRGNHEEYVTNDRLGFLDQINILFSPLDAIHIHQLNLRNKYLVDVLINAHTPYVAAPPNLQHTQINTILSYLPSAHRIFCGSEAKSVLSTVSINAASSILPNNCSLAINNTCSAKKLSLRRIIIFNKESVGTVLMILLLNKEE
jgi:hypothetical protein